MIANPSTLVPIVEMFGEAVKAVEAKLLPYLKEAKPGTQQLHYEYDTPKKMVETLVNMNTPQQYQFQKYPLVGLLMPFTENRGAAITTEGNLKLNVIIANQTVPELSTKDRYAQNFKPILYPIAEELIRQLSQSKYFLTMSEWDIKHDWRDRPFWGKEGLYGNDGNVFADCLDCIQLNNITLTVRKQFCKDLSKSKLFLPQTSLNNGNTESTG